MSSSKLSAPTKFLLVVTLLLTVTLHNFGPQNGSAFSWSFGASDQDAGKAANPGNNRHYKNRDLQLEEVLSQGEEKCMNKPCVQSEQCCPGSVCVDTHSTGKRQGTCLPIYGVNEGDNCNDDDDCEPGLRCLTNQLIQIPGTGSEASAASSSTGPVVSGRDGDASVLMASMSGSGHRRTTTRTCQPPGQDMRKKQYNDECSSSGECDASHGLCCQQIKRHRMAPRKACLYFSDPAICIGPVDVTFARPMAYSSYYYTPNEHEYFRARIG